MASTGYRRNTEVAFGQRADIPCLEHVAAGRGHDQHRYAEQSAQCATEFAASGEALFQSFLQHIHRTAVRVVRVVGVAIEHRQRDFGELDRHAEQADIICMPL